MTQWYYVDGTERIGPIGQEAIEEHIANGTLNLETYVWKKGFPNWVKIRDIEELSAHAQTVEEVEIASDTSDNQSQFQNQATDELEKKERRSRHSESSTYEKEIKVDPIQLQTLNFDRLTNLDRDFFIKIGQDRGLEFEVEYGPYSLDEMRLMFTEGRVNEKTLVSFCGLNKWQTFSEFEKIDKITDKKLIKHSASSNDPVYFSLLHDGESVFGIIRDLSIGGGQFLTKEILPLQKKLTAQMFWGNRKPVGVHFVVTRRLEDKSGYVIRFLSLTANLRALVENVFQLE